VTSDQWFVLGMGVIVLLIFGVPAVLAGIDYRSAISVAARERAAEIERRATDIIRHRGLDQRKAIDVATREYVAELKATGV
jgi:hypothetical protein